MRFSPFLSVTLLAVQIDFSSEDCRVLADCEGGSTRWIVLQQNIAAGRPGKRGAPGPRGEKGDPGVGVNVTELKKQLNPVGDGPKRYLFTPTLTYDSAKTFCEGFDRVVCSFDEICIPEKGGRRFIHDVIHGNHWVPVSDRHNEWVEIGDNHGAPCFLHNVRWSEPSWGVSTESGAWKGFVYCCRGGAPSTRLPDMRYQYVGRSATYVSSQQHCEKQGRRLCYSSEICHASSPRFGVAGEGNHWAAIKDRINDWIQIGKSGRACGLHGIQFGLPTWGMRNDNSLLDHVGYVFCCAK